MFADDMLVKNAVAKIDDGDVILTYGYSSTVFAIFMQAQQVRSLWLTRPQCLVSSSASGNGVCNMYHLRLALRWLRCPLRLPLPTQCLPWCGLGLMQCPGMSASRPCVAGWQALQGGGGRCAAPSGGQSAAAAPHQTRHRLHIHPPERRRMCHPGILRLAPAAQHSHCDMSVGGCSA